jgi:hypothetical protein
VLSSISVWKTILSRIVSILPGRCVVGVEEFILIEGVGVLLGVVVIPNHEQPVTTSVKASISPQKAEREMKRHINYPLTNICSSSPG